MKMPTTVGMFIFISRENFILCGVEHENINTLGTGPSCSKLTMSLVNDSLKFTSSDTQICWNFLLKKCE